LRREGLHRFRRTIALWIPGGRQPEVDFGVERHTLVIEKIIQIFHRTSTIVIQVATVRAHLFRVEGIAPEQT
jgi:hypothetical protein